MPARLARNARQESLTNKRFVIFPPLCDHALPEELVFSARVCRRCASSCREGGGRMVLRGCVGGLLLGIAGVFAVAPAKAADLPVPTKSPPAVAPVPLAPAAIYNWTGFYLGGQIGGVFAHSSWSDPFSGGRDRFNSSAGL